MSEAPHCAALSGVEVSEVEMSKCRGVESMHNMLCEIALSRRASGGIRSCNSLRPESVSVKAPLQRPFSTTPPQRQIRDFFMAGRVIRLEMRPTRDTHIVSNSANTPENFQNGTTGARGNNQVQCAPNRTVCIPDLYLKNRTNNCQRFSRKLEGPGLTEESAPERFCFD